MKLTKAIIPNTLTCCNFLCGSIAVIYAVASMDRISVYLSDINYDAWISDISLGYLGMALLFILLGAVFDFFDGMSARLLHVDNPIGKDLDSLADATTFGLAPSLVIVSFLNPIIGGWSFLALIMAAFSITRLAKFNHDTRQTTSFIGLATPANAIFWASTIPTLLISEQKIFLHPCSAWIILALSFVSCYLLISEIPFFSLKFHDLKWQGNEIRYVFIIGAVLILIAALITGILLRLELLIPAISCIMIYYIILALVNNVITRK